MDRYSSDGNYGYRIAADHSMKNRGLSTAGETLTHTGKAVEAGVGALLGTPLFGIAMVGAMGGLGPAFRGLSSVAVKSARAAKSGAQSVGSFTGKVAMSTGGRAASMGAGYVGGKVQNLTNRLGGYVSHQKGRFSRFIQSGMKRSRNMSGS